MERNRAIKDIEGFEDYVTESGNIRIVDDYGATEFPYVKESFIKELTKLSDYLPTQVKIKKLLDTVVTESADFEKSMERTKYLEMLPGEKKAILALSLMSIEKQRLKTTPVTVENKKNYDILFAVSDIIDDCCEIMSSGFPDKDLSYIEMAANTIQDCVSKIKVHPLKHIVSLKLSSLYELVEMKGSPVVKKIFSDAMTFKDSEHSSLDRIISLVRNKNGELASYLKDKKNRMESEIDIILSDYAIDSKTFIQRSLQSSKFEIVPTVIQSLKGGLSLTRLKEAFCKSSNVTIDLSGTDIFRFKVAFPAYAVERCITEEGEYVWLASTNTNVRILLKDVNTSDLLYIKLVENCSLENNLETVLGDDPVQSSGHRVLRVKYHGPSDIDIESVTEGIKFTEEGGVKLTYKPVNTYMDDYSRINKVLVLNHKNGNTEGMKTDLVYLFSFINELEKITKGKVRVNGSVKEDAVKARMFAIGDFKRYLAIVQEADPMFNFSKHFEENFKNEDKVMIEFSNAEIKGFKKLLRTIMGY